MTTPTLRRLDDREKYWGLTWAGWLAIVTGFAGLYVAVRLSPFGTKPTITITVILLTFVGMVLHGVSGQALSPGRQLLAIVRYRRSAKLLELPDRADRHGLVLDAAPAFRADDADVALETPGADSEPAESSSPTPLGKMESRGDDEDWLAEPELDDELELLFADDGFGDLEDL
jgi:hypothetical protein